MIDFYTFKDWQFGKVSLVKMKGLITVKIQRLSNREKQFVMSTRKGRNPSTAV